MARAPQPTTPDLPAQQRRTAVLRLKVLHGSMTPRRIYGPHIPQSPGACSFQRGEAMTLGNRRTILTQPTWDVSLEEHLRLRPGGIGASPNQSFGVVNQEAVSMILKEERYKGNGSARMASMFFPSHTLFIESSDGPLLFQLRKLQSLLLDRGDISLQLVEIAWIRFPPTISVELPDAPRLVGR